MRHVKRSKPTDPERPFLFRHRYGTLQVYATKRKEAVKAALAYCSGLPVTLIREVPRCVTVN